jgi:lipoate-protein ligase A
MEPTGPALVLGSTQPDSDVDRYAAEREGVEVTRRRSGGGAVLLAAGGVVWIDVLVPAGDELWKADVGAACWWVGDAWVRALQSMGSTAQATVWTGPLRSTEWSALVCFAGVGPGEVLVKGRKVVGISQRRTREAALFQTAALLSWDPADTVRLLALGPSARRRAEHDLAASAAGVDVPAFELVDAFLAHLPA